jgi:hypothetical protein
MKKHAAKVLGVGISYVWSDGIHCFDDFEWLCTGENPVYPSEVAGPPAQVAEHL